MHITKMESWAICRQVVYIARACALFGSCGSFRRVGRRSYVELKRLPRLLISTRFDSTAQPSTPSVSPHTFHQNGTPRLHHVYSGAPPYRQSHVHPILALHQRSLPAALHFHFFLEWFRCCRTQIYMAHPRSSCQLPCPPVLAFHVCLSSATAVGVVIRFAW